MSRPRSILVVTRQRKIGIGRLARNEIYEDSPGSNDLAVRLQGHSGRVTTLWKSRRHDAAVSKGTIERSVRVVADHFEIAQKVKSGKAPPATTILPSGLYNHREYRRQTREICSHSATRAEGGSSVPSAL